MSNPNSNAEPPKPAKPEAPKASVRQDGWHPDTRRIDFGKKAAQ
jgi:hypothetical protein